MSNQSPTILSVPDMTCGHCKAAVEGALAPLAQSVTVDLAARRVIVMGADSAERLIATLVGIGFPAERLSA